MPNGTTNIVVSAQVNATKANGNFGTDTLQRVFGGAFPFTVGSGANQYNSVYAAGRTVTSGTPDTFDLVTGLTNPDGTAIVFTDVCVILIKNNAASGGGTLAFGGGANDFASLLGTSGIENILPQTVVAIVCPLAAGYVVNASTAHVMQFTSSSGTVNYDVLVMGH